MSAPAPNRVDFHQLTTNNWWLDRIRERAWASSGVFIVFHGPASCEKTVSAWLMYAEELQGQSDARIMFNGYRSVIDKFFFERLIDPKTPCPLKQKTPRRLLEIIELLAHTNLEGRSRIANFLLDISGDWREYLSNGIDEELARQPETRRPKPMSTHGGVNLTVYCWTPWSLPRDNEQALFHGQTVLLVNGEIDRLLLELFYDSNGLLQTVSWLWIDKAGILMELLPKLEANAIRLREKRVKIAKTERGKIGRNEFCPCGSSKKYKRCCGAG